MACETLGDEFENRKFYKQGGLLSTKLFKFFAA